MTDNKKRSKRNRIIAFVSVIALFTTLITDLMGFSNLILTERDLSGEWFMTFTTQESTYHPYMGMTLGYKIHVIQNGLSISGEGETWTVNDSLLPYSRHRPLEIEGRISKDTMYCRYTLIGGLRTTTGSFKAYINQNTLRGSFSGTAADSKGTFHAYKVR